MSASVGSLSKLLWFVSQFKTPSVASSFEWIHQTGNSSSQNLLAQKTELPVTVWCRCLSAHTDTQILFFRRWNRRNHAAHTCSSRGFLQWRHWSVALGKGLNGAKHWIRARRMWFWNGNTFVLLSVFLFSFCPPGHFLHSSRLVAIVYFSSAALYIKGNDVTKLASMAKLKGGRLAREVGDSCLQYWGGMGYTSDVLVSRFYR